MTEKEMMIISEQISKQEGRKYPCSNQVVVCGFFSTEEEVGSILKIPLERLNKKNKEVEIGHTCSTCKHRCTETWTTPDWGFEEVWHNWCSLD